MKTIKNLLLITIIALNIQGCKSQTYTFYFNGEKVNKIDEEANWYLIGLDSKIKKCHPKVEFVKDEENDFSGNIFLVNEEAVVVFKSSKKIDLKDIVNQIDKTTWITKDSKIKLNNHESLIGRNKRINDDEILSLFIKDSKTRIEYEIFRNCSLISKQDSYFGCGRTPFQLEFLGDIANDEKPELIISADKEGGVLKLIIGFQEGKYQILKWIEFE